MCDDARVHDVSCVVHVHSTYPDGAATVPELLAAAREAGADALLLTDHDSLGARRDGWEGSHDGVFLLVGTEVSPREGHHLAFGVEQEIAHAGRPAREIAIAVRAAGGVGFAAHPFSDGGNASPAARAQDRAAARLAGTRGRLRRHRAVEPDHRRGRGVAHAGRGMAVAACA